MEISWTSEEIRVIFVKDMSASDGLNMARQELNDIDDCQLNWIDWLSSVQCVCSAPELSTAIYTQNWVTCNNYKSNHFDTKHHTL